MDNTSLWKKEFPPPKTERRSSSRMLRKDKGQATFLIGLFFLLFLLVIVGTQVKVYEYRMTARYLEDALAASNLASAVIDVEAYGVSHRIWLKNPRNAFERFCEALEGNLNLDESLQSRNSLIKGSVTVENYTIYNVDGDYVLITRVNPAGGSTFTEERLGTVRSPNGIPIESTSVYSEISFRVAAPFGGEETARMGKLVDIVRNEEEM